MSEISIFELEAEHGELLPERETLGRVAIAVHSDTASVSRGQQRTGRAGSYAAVEEHRSHRQTIYVG